jgi:acetyl esterase/lipase
MAVLAALLLLVALAGLWPVGPHAVSPRLLFPVWFPSWIAQSFAQPLVVVALVVIAIETPRSPAWGAVALAAALGFVLLDHRNRVAGRRLLRAVGAQARIPPLAGLLPLGVGARGVVRTAHAYGSGGERQRLDLIVARGSAAGTPRPVLIHVPGGAWVSGAKNQQARPLLHHLARAGWLCVDINYRLGPDHRFPAMIEDVLAAIAWVKANAAAHGGDPGFVALTGGSAGGHLVALAALAHDDPAFKPGFEDADARVDAAVPLYGRFDFLDRHWRLGKRRDHLLHGFMSDKVMPVPPDADPALWHAASPLDRLRADAPPMLLTHGTGDTLLPAAEAEEFAEALAAVSSAAVRYVPLAGLQHAYDIFASALTWAHVRAVEHWLNAQRREQAPAGSGPA